MTQSHVTVGFRESDITTSFTIVYKVEDDNLENEF